MYVKKPPAEPIPGYRLLGPLGKGGFGEVWKCEAPGGLFKAIKFVYSDRLTDPTGAGVQQELRTLQLIKSIRHPFLLSIERIEVIDGEALIVMELDDRSLHDLLTEYQAAGKAGIPRAELLSYPREAAEALDVLNQEHGLQHLDIKPRILFLIGRHVKVADFGLVTSLSDLQNSSSWMRRSEAVTPLYAAPESFLGRFTPVFRSVQFGRDVSRTADGRLAVHRPQLSPTGAAPRPGSAGPRTLARGGEADPRPRARQGAEPALSLM